MKHLNIILYKLIILVILTVDVSASDTLSLSEEQSTSSSSYSRSFSLSRTPSPEKPMLQNNLVMTEESSKYFISLFNQLESVMSTLDFTSKILFREQAGSTCEKYFKVLRNIYQPTDTTNSISNFSKHNFVLKYTCILVDDLDNFMTEWTPAKLAKIHQMSENKSNQAIALEATYKIFARVQHVILAFTPLFIHVLKNSYIAIREGEYNPNDFGEIINPKLEWLRSAKEKFIELDQQFKASFPKEIKKIQKDIKKYPNGKQPKKG